VPPVAGEWRVAGLPVDSPLGIPAGPLNNGKWRRYYASLVVLAAKTPTNQPFLGCIPIPIVLSVDAANGT